MDEFIVCKMLLQKTRTSFLTFLAWEKLKLIYFSYDRSLLAIWNYVKTHLKVNNEFRHSFSKSIIIALILLCVLTPCQCSSNNSFSEPVFGNRILNGMRAEDYQFPFQVSLQKKKQHYCGGSIISEVKVLTAGHCVTNENGIQLRTALYRILAGTNKLNTKEPKNYYSVNKFAIHPNFDRRTVQYDYAVVFINENFDLQSKKISTIPLATQDPLPGVICFVSGWGDVDGSIGLTVPNELQFARITVDPPKVCLAIYKKHFSSKQMLCAGQSNKENAGCGDSGGPFVCNNTLNGIVSFGKEFDDSKMPDVYSSVTHVSDWINSTDGVLLGAQNGSSKHTVDGFYCVSIFTALLITHILLAKQT